MSKRIGLRPMGALVKARILNLYVGLNLSPARVVKVSPAFLKIGTLTLNSGENLSYHGALLIVGGYLYVATRSFVVKISLSTFSRVDALAMPTAGYICLASSGGFLYAGSTYGRGRITKIDLSTFTIVSTLELTAPADFASLSHILISGGYLYSVHLYDTTYTTSVIEKIDLSTFTIDSTLTLGFYDTAASYGLVKGNYLYVACATDPARVVKIDLSTFTVDSTLTLLTNEGFAGCLSEKDNLLYVGLGWTWSYGKVAKIDLATFTRVACLTLDVTEIAPWEMYIAGADLYVALNTTPGKIAKIDLPSFTQTATLTLDAGEDSCYAITRG